MPIGYDYRCSQCGHDWVLFSKRYVLGPIQWGETKYTCFTCQSFLSIATTVDANSWAVWCRHNESAKDNAILARLAEDIDSQLSERRGIAPISLEILSIECPTCQEAMSTVPFGQHLMKCPQCRGYTGEFQAENGIGIYGWHEESQNDE